MQIEMLTLFPKMFASLEFGIVGRAIRNQLLQINYWDPRNYTEDFHRTVDDRPYGGGPGMVMKFEPLHKAIQAAKNNSTTPAPVILFSPQGKTLTQDEVENLSQQQRLILVAGRYEGIDERLIELDIDRECSVGDYVVSGGEFPAMILIDAITRLLPGALGHEDSASQDSFSHGLLDYPHYTRPEVIAGKTVPKILLSGDHQAIADWRCKQALGKTWQKRPDLLKRQVLTAKEQTWLEEFITDHANENE